MSRYKVNNDLVPRFNRLSIRSTDEYDEKYFPKATKVKVYYNSSEERPLWVLDPEFDYPNQAYELKRIRRNDRRFRKIVNPLLESEEYDISINKVFKINNPYLERQYELKKEQKENYEELRMYHTTIPANVHGICTNNFNWRKSGESRGSKYGFGVSFSPDPDFTHQFCKSKHEKVMFVVKVLISASSVGKKGQILPPPGFDTTRSPLKTVFVKFEDSEFYPEYVIYYEIN